MKTKLKSRAVAMFLTMACAIVMTITSGCKGDIIVLPPPPAELFIDEDDTTHTFSAENADTFIVKVYCNDSTWYVKSDNTWLKAERQDETVVITVTDNESESERTGKVTVECGETTKTSKVITIIQEGLVVNLGVSDFDGSFAPDANGEEYAKEITISSSHSWGIEDIPEWLAFNDTEGDGDKIIKVWPTSVNATSTDRETAVKVKSKSKEISINIVQKHLQFEISDTEKLFEFFSAGEKYAQGIDITCNASWEISGKPDWLDIEALKGSGDQNVKVWPNSNNSSTSERSVVLTIKAAGQEKNVKVVQSNNVPWSFCPDITLGLERTSDEILAIFGDDGIVLDEQVGYISYNDNIMALIFALDSNNACDNAMSQFRGSVSNDQVINHCNSHYETDVMIDLAIMIYNQQNWKGWAKHDKEGEITTMIIYDTEKKILTATPFNSNEEKSVKGKDTAKETEKAIIRTFTKMADMLKKH